MNRRISFEAHAVNEEQQIMCYAVNCGGAVLSVFEPRIMEDKNGRHFNFTDEEFFSYVDDLNKLVKIMKGEK